MKGQVCEIVLGLESPEGNAPPREGTIKRNHRKEQKGKKPESLNLAPKDWRTKETQNDRQDAERFANKQTPRNRTFRNYVQDVPGESAERRERHRLLSSSYDEVVLPTHRKVHAPAMAKTSHHRTFR